MPDQSTLAAFAKELRNNSEILSTDEAKIKQKVVLPVLHQLGWDIFNELEPELSAGKNRVDYALKILNTYKVFLEVKRPSEDPTDHQEQLLGYSFSAGIPLAVLTNGITWMGLVIPGFIPTPLGEMMEYRPSLNETLVCFGIWAFGLLCYTVFLRMSVPILQGRLSKENEGAPAIHAAAASEEA